MGLFKIGRGKDGKRKMDQVATDEELRLQRGESLVDAIEAEPVAKVLPLRPPPSPHAGSAAYRALSSDLHKQSVQWAKKFIAKLDKVEEVDRIRVVEETHPKYNGGREGVLNALVGKLRELEGGHIEKHEGEEEGEEEAVEESEFGHGPERSS